MAMNNKYKFAKKLESEEEYKKLADDLLAFAQKESTLNLGGFPLSLTIYPKDFSAFSEHSEYFAIAYDTAMQLIAERLKRLALEGVIDRQFALEMLPLHDYEYRKWKISLKQKDETPPGQTKIQMVYAPEYHTVPDSAWVKYNMLFAAKHGYTEDGLNKRLKNLCDILNGKLEEEDMEVLVRLAEKINAQGRGAILSSPQEDKATHENNHEQ